MDINIVLDRLGNVKTLGKNQYIAYCPAHDDRNPSLSIKNDDGNAILFCHAGCSYEDILKAVGLIDTPSFNIPKKNSVNRSIEATYDYTNKDGKVVYQVIRYNPKQFSQRKPDGNGGWTNKGPDDEAKVLYRLDRIAMAIAESKTIFVVEGEKDADNLNQLGLAATTNVGGAGKWLPQYTESLQNANVAILPDNDTPGKNHALKIANELLHKASSVRIIELPGLSPKGDVSDWINNGGTAGELIHHTIEAKPYNPDMDLLPDPTPLTRPEERPKDYPIDQLPIQISQAILEYANYGQQPISMIAGAALATLSLAAQGLADVQRDHMLSGPTSIYLITVAESGERKTAADKSFRREIYNWVEETNAEIRINIKAYKTQHKVWKQEEQCIEKAYARACENPNEQSKETLQGKLNEHAKQEPSEPRLLKLLHTDANAASLGEAISNGHPSVALWTNEGTQFVGSNGMKTDNAMAMMGILTSLWDNEPYTSTRKCTTPTEIAGRRFTVSLMMQDVAFKRVLEDNNRLCRGSGFLARCLITRPISTIGHRHYIEPSENMVAIEKFHSRIKELMNTPLQQNEQGELSPYCLKLSPEAKHTWVEFFDAIEKSLGHHGEYELIKDFGSKAAENVARLAALLHLFEHGPTGKIDKINIQRGCSLIKWYLDETLRVFSLLDRPEEEDNAIKLLEWMKDKHRDDAITMREIQRLGPNRIRERHEAIRAVTFLIENGHLLSDHENISRANLRINPKCLKKTAQR